MNIDEIVSIQEDLQDCMTSYDNMSELESINDRLINFIKENK